jgi:ankyrin repeat protein
MIAVVSTYSLVRHVRHRPEPDSPNGFSVIVGLLLAAGADPNTLSKHSYNPLMGACLCGDIEICKLLLQACVREHRFCSCASPTTPTPRPTAAPVARPAATYSTAPTMEKPP